jgi:hypothetical protein
MPKRQPKRVKTLKEEQDKWYARLAKDGFKDIEDRDEKLKQYASSALTHNYRVPLVFDAKERYYQLAGQFLHMHKFDSRLEKFMWSQHCEGVSIEDIVDKVKIKGMKTYKREVHETLQRLTKEMLAGTGDESEW